MRSSLNLVTRMEINLELQIKVENVMSPANHRRNDSHVYLSNALSFLLNLLCTDLIG